MRRELGIPVVGSPWWAAGNVKGVKRWERRTTKGKCVFEGQKVMVRLVVIDNG
jgi:hypothetical protein